MNFLVIVLIFTIFRILDFGVIFHASRFIPYLGHFSHPGTLLNYHLHPLLTAWANFDGVFYLRIAKNGYSQFEQAFFPLYPVVIRLIRQIELVRNELLIGLLISNLAFVIGLFVFTKYIKPNKSFWPILILLTFPTSFFFGAVYTEGLFFLLVVLTLYFLKKEKFIGAAVTTFLASLTRFIGVFLIIPIIFKFITLKSKVRQSFGSKVLLLFAPILGLGSYCLYLLKTTGDPFFFLNSQLAFGAQRSTSLILFPQVIYRYFKIFFTAAHNFQYYVSIYEFLIFNLVFFVLIWDLVRKMKAKIPVLNDLGCPAKRGGPTGVKNVVSSFHDMGLNLFSLANLLLPTLTGTFSSIPRYALLSLSFFIFLGQMRNIYFKIFIAVIFFLLHILSLGFFIQGYFVS